MDNYATFTREFNALLLEYHSKRHNTYMCGDYNIDLLKVNKVHSYDMYFNDILSAGYIPTITLPTRLSTSSTLIDNIFTTNISKEVKACILNVHISDHQPILLFTDEKAPVSKSKYITIRTNSEQAKAAFCLSFRNQQVLQKLDADTVDPNSNYAILEKSLKNSHDECFPMHVVKFNPKRHKKTPWITDDIIKSINVRNKLYKKLKQCRSNAFNYTEMQANFNRYRNDLKKAITHAKRSHYKTLFERFKFDMKKTWSIISENLNQNVRNPITDKMTINGVDCCDKQVIADNFNSFFASIGEQNARNITEEHGNSSYRDYLTDRIDSQFIFRTIDNNYTIQIIKNIKTSRSTGHDGISSELLKLINNDISACITLIINQSIKSGIFPDRLKIAKVTPIYKKDDKTFIKNYRPISVLPVISKIFETVICDQLCEYFSSKNLLCSQQYGFRKNSSTELAALEVIDKLLTQLDGQLIPINFYLDLSKAFDSLN